MVLLVIRDGYPSTFSMTEEWLSPGLSANISSRFGPLVEAFP
jgi:hypothetical protein